MKQTAFWREKKRRV